MIICICQAVSDRVIAAHARNGCASFDELQLETGVATRCGCCRSCAEQAFEQHRGSRAGGQRPVAMPQAGVEGVRA